MTFITVFRIILLVFLIICAIATAASKKPMMAVIIFTAYSIIMSVVWLLLRSPDLAITEAAVGAGVTGVLFFLTLRGLHLIDKDKNKNGIPDDEEEEETKK
ncbi:MAG: Na(+)/H(+) antiporter subunit B [Eubacteriales bacterium]